MTTTSQKLTSQKIEELLRSHADPPRWTKWLLEFAEQDLEIFNRKQWERLGRDLKELLESSYDLARLWKKPLARPSSEFWDCLRKGLPKELKDPTCLKALQSQFREALDALLPDTLDQISSHVGKWKVPISGLNFELVSIVVEKGKKRLSRKTRITRLYSTGWPGIFWLVVADLLELGGAALLRQLEFLST